MNKDIKSLLINTFGTISCLLVIFFFVTYILFSHNGVQDALKESWSASLAFFSVLATLGAAVIAAYLFNDWRIIHNNTSLKEQAVETYKTYDRLNVKLISVNDVFVKALKANKTGTNYNISKVADDIEPEVKDIGDLLALLLHQIAFIDDLANDKNELEIVDNMHEALVEYMGIMDISVYRRTDDHDIFMEKEAVAKTQLDDLRAPFIKYLRNFILIDM